MSREYMMHRLAGRVARLALGAALLVICGGVGGGVSAQSNAGVQEILNNALTRYSSGEIDNNGLAAEVVRGIQGASDPRESVRDLGGSIDSRVPGASAGVVYFRLAEYFELVGDTGTAISLYRRALEVVSVLTVSGSGAPARASAGAGGAYDTVAVQLRLATLYFMDGQLDEARGAVDTVLRRAVRTDDLHLALILGARVEGYAGGDGMGESIAKLQRFVRENSSSRHVRVAYLALYELLRLNGDSAGAAEVRGELVRLFPASLEAAIVDDSETGAKVIAGSVPPAAVTLAYSGLRGDSLHGHEHADGNEHTHEGAGESAGAGAAVPVAGAGAAETAPVSAAAAAAAAAVARTPAPVPTAAAAAATAGGEREAKIYLQAGSFRTRGYADQLREQIIKMSLESHIRIEQGLFRVVVPASAANVSRVKATLSDAGIDTFVLR